MRVTFHLIWFIVGKGSIEAMQCNDGSDKNYLFNVMILSEKF